MYDYRKNVIFETDLNVHLNLKTFISKKTMENCLIEVSIVCVLILNHGLQKCVVSLFCFEVSSLVLQK